MSCWIYVGIAGLIEYLLKLPFLLWRAGDSVAATLSVCIALGMPIREATEVANVAARLQPLPQLNSHKT